ncbi:MAG: asparagine synthetase [Geoglossum umbratile]|nr:MAG: asparagine synthetase [Geoglossum umbratile]
MCGIFACHRHPDVQKFKPTALQLAKAVRHRGPDWNGWELPAHERLSIVGVDSGAQPLTNGDGTLILTVNGEIYNHRAIRKHLKQYCTFKTHSDSEVIIPLYVEHGVDAPKFLDGMFSWVLYDKGQDRVVAARDPIGITSFYQGWWGSTLGAVYFATVRAGIPMFLLSRKIKATSVKVVLSGEGSDEIFGGYVYFGAAPDKNSFHKDTVRQVKNLYLSCCLRANKSATTWGLELRVPFLDKQVSRLIPFYTVERRQHF